MTINELYALIEEWKTALEHERELRTQLAAALNDGMVASTPDAPAMTAAGSAGG